MRRCISHHFASWVESLLNTSYLPRSPDGEDDFYGAHPEYSQSWSRLPKIMQAQPDGYLDMHEPPVHYPNRLSTITERTEKTEAPSMFTKPESTIYRYGGTSAAALIDRSVLTPVLDRSMSHRGNLTSHSIDPNSIPLSPPASAIDRLSLNEGPPSNDPSLSRGSTGDQESVGSVPGIEVLPDIPDYASRSTKPAPKGGKAPSKLSQLASSRASALSARSEGSQLSAGSNSTLRQQRHSYEYDATPSSAVSKDLPPVPNEYEESSVASSIIRKVINNALYLEELDRAEAPKRSRNPSPPQAQGHQENISTPSVARSVASSATPSTTRRGAPSVADSASPSATPSAAPSTSKLSRKAESKVSSLKSAPSLASSALSPSSRSSLSARPMSKLALLAQQKAEARGPKLPEPSTEYLTPIANGPTVTTAITTSYQSLWSLTDPNRSNMIPRLDVVPIGAKPPKTPQSPSSPPSASSEKKQSKLALKAKRGHEKSLVKPESPVPEVEDVPPVLPIFQPSPVIARASPSAFASVLLDGQISPQPPAKGSTKAPSVVDGEVTQSSRTADNVSSRRSKTASSRAPSVVSSSTVSIDSCDSHPHRKKKKHIAPPSATGSTVTKGFAFDSPSPDDIVLQARQGTKLHKVAGSATSQVASSVGQ